MAINTADLTTQSLTGTGVLDVLLATIKLHLDREYNEERIKGNEYSGVYTQLVSAALQAAVQYAVSKPEVDAKVTEMTQTLPYVVSNAEATSKKSNQELQLLWEKTMTERANTQEQILAGYGSTTGIPVLGVVGKQKTLYQNQSEGYVKDAITKAAKVYADVAMLQLNTNENYTNGSNNLGDAYIASMMAKLQASV